VVKVVVGDDNEADVGNRTPNTVDEIYYSGRAAAKSGIDKR